MKRAAAGIIQYLVLNIIMSYTRTLMKPPVGNLLPVVIVNVILHQL